MTKNPFVNGLAAAAYIALLALGALIIPQFIPESPNFVTGMITVLSLLVFSVAVMAYTIILAPCKLALEGKHKEAAVFFLKTLLAFALGAVVIFGASFLLPPMPEPGL